MQTRGPSESLPPAVLPAGGDTANTGEAIPPDIMVVDDHPSNVNLLEGMLRRRGYQVRKFTRAHAALESAIQQPPELVLLDITMPEMNGYEMCARLKTYPDLAEVPVIFLSGLNETSDKVQAFRAGGVDYISKPFEFDEVYARVATHLRLHQLKRTLQHQNAFLDAIVKARTRQLSEAHDRLSLLDKAKSEFLQMISHELRTPLNGVLGTAELILSGIDGEGCESEIGEMFAQSRERVLAILDSALLLTQIEVGNGTFHTRPVLFADALVEAMEGVRAIAHARGVRLEYPRPEAGTTTGDRELLVKGLRALMEIAVRFSQAGDRVLITQLDDTRTTVVAISTGSGRVPPAAIARFFDLFGVNEANSGAGDLGLTPAMAGRILSLFGGSASVTNLEPAGIQLEVSCPRAGSGTDEECESR